MTKQSLSLANCAISLSFIYQVSKSAIMLLSADSSNGTLAEQSICQLKELLSASLARKGDGNLDFGDMNFSIFE